jgi:hypothetical protein
MVALVGYTYTNDINGLRFQANANLERIEKAVAIQNQTVATQQQIILTINKTHDRYEALFYDNPKPIPQLHLSMWDLCCLPEDFVGIAAPRKHAKSTAITHAYTLANMLFRVRQYAIITSNTIDMSCEFLHDIKTELWENTNIQRLFEIDDIYRDTTQDLQVRFKDGKKFRIMAKGALQAMRGVKWEHKRPDLLIGDDLENDEMVMNDDRRAKFSDWFHKVWIPIRSDDGIVRVVGTILHEDSLLNGVINSKSWHSALFKAHNSFNDFGNILWPEQWSEPKLRQERQLFIDAGTPEGYSQEYLNDPAESPGGSPSPEHTTSGLTSQLASRIDAHSLLWWWRELTLAGDSST